MSHYPTPRERTKRAFGAYMEVLETADWLKGELHGPLLMYDLSMGDFRLLEMLHREGALFAPDIARRRRLHKQAVAVIVKRLSKRGFVLREDRQASAGGVSTGPRAGVEAGRAAGGNTDERRRADEIREEIHRRGPAEPYEDGEGVACEL